MKKIYLVRHGTTNHIKNNQFQDYDTKLSPEGEEQAKSAGQYLRAFPIETIISSDMERARKTAEIIKNTLGEIPHIEVPLFKEWLRPTAVRNKPKEDTEIQKIMQEIAKHQDEPEWRHSDEENFSDLKKRIQDAIAYLERHESDHIAVVSHADAIKMMLALHMTDKTVTYPLYEKIISCIKMQNGGVSILEFENGVWAIKNLNLNLSA